MKRTMNNKTPCNECGYYEDNVAYHYDNCSILNNID